MPLVRLDKMLSDAGLCSRSQAKERIRSGAILVNGTPVSDPSLKLDPEQSTVTCGGRTVSREEHIYVMLYKPDGLLSATEDARKPTVLDLMPAEWKKRGLFPVGRLDKDTTGFLILTDDGDFAHRVISPRSGVPKLYEAVVDGVPNEDDLCAFRDGIVLADGTECLPATLIPVGDHTVRVEVFEGKYHQVKRMLASRRLPVQSLKRLRIGKLWLDKALRPGEFRKLSAEELTMILPSYCRNDQL